MWRRVCNETASSSGGPGRGGRQTLSGAVSRAWSQHLAALRPSAPSSRPAPPAPSLGLQVILLPGRDRQLPPALGRKMGEWAEAWAQGQSTETLPNPRGKQKPPLATCFSPGGRQSMTVELC